MPHIRYSAYSFNPPSVPLSRGDFEKIKGMNANDFKEYVSSLSSFAWRMFRDQHKFEIYAFLWGGFGGALVAFIFQTVDVIAGIAIIACLLAFFALLSLAMSSSTYLHYVEAQKVFYRKRREVMVLANSYEEYCTLDS